MNKNIKTILITILIIILTMGSAYFLVSGNAFKEVILAEQGYIDLTNYSYSNEGAIKLDGEWEFYPDKLINPGDFSGNNGIMQYIKVPGKWDEYLKNDTDSKGLGYGTYRLIVNTNGENQIYGLKTSIIRLSNKIFVNGRLISRDGKTSTEKTDYIPENSSDTSYFEINQNKVEIVIQVSNFDFVNGGIINSISFGDYPSIQKIDNYSKNYDWIFITGFLLNSIYFFGLFYQRKKDIYYLYLSLYCLFLPIYTITHGEKLLYTVFPLIEYHLFEKVALLPISLAFISLSLYMYHAYEGLISKNTIKINIFIGILLFIFTLLPITIISEYLFLYTIYSLYSALFVLYFLTKGTLNKIYGSSYLLIGGIMMFFDIAINTFNILGYSYVYIMPPVEPFIFILTQALMLSGRFNKTHEEIENLSTRLINSDRLKDDILIRTSHEFRTPLNGIISIAQNYMEMKDIPDKQKEDINLIGQIASRLSNMVEDIIDFSNINEGKLKINTTKTNSKKLIDVVIEVFNYIEKNNSTQIINSISDKLPPIEVDKSRFIQIISNLIENALKNTKDGIIEVSALEKESFIEFCVSDNGKGIKEEDLERIFLPYQQSRQIDGYIGIGIGLSVVKQLVEIHKGVIRVNSKIDEGTKFTFTLPISRTDELESDTDYNNIETKLVDNILINNNLANDFRTPFHSDTGEVNTILILDDDTMNLNILTNILVNEKYNVIATKNKLEFLDSFEKFKNKIDLIILDLMIPGTSGIELSNYIRKKYDLVELPILMFTASIYPSNMLKAFESGANDFIKKPFDLLELKSRIKSLILTKSSAESARRMELAFLQAQVKPHFLSNALNTILYLCYTDIEEAKKMILNLSIFLRESFDFSNSNELISVNKELEMIKAYLKIEEARFENKIEVSFDLQYLGSIMIPPFILQTLVENAITHGILPKKGKGKIQISVFEIDYYAVIRISDNGVGIHEDEITKIFDTENNTKNIGLKNIRKRLSHIPNANFELKSERDKGTEIKIKIPIKK